MPVYNGKSISFIEPTQANDSLPPHYQSQFNTLFGFRDILCSLGFTVSVWEMKNDGNGKIQKPHIQMYMFILHVHHKNAVEENER
ncbi:hypothetical protein PV327_002126 [Microctonus hyperodae]|uniref:Uncharacterized protein n=1 Tax=Microctonus hyperodae TaxID=165561 RepID=A0AA39FEZ0_MICHY|nr:hypothetical protein PV327_002126 [Microctonus hyperodae]